MPSKIIYRNGYSFSKNRGVTTYKHPKTGEDIFLRHNWHGRQIVMYRKVIYPTVKSAMTKAISDIPPTT